MSAVNIEAGARHRRSQDNPAVLTIAFPYAPIGPKAVGGAEVICSQVETAMNAFGFRSVVVAHESSVPQGLLYGTRIPKGTITDAMRASVEAAQQANIDRAIRENPVGLVHMHGLDFHRYQIPKDLRIIVTLHLPPSWYPEAIWDLSERYQFVCVSESQRKACPERVQGRLSVVENGVVLPPLNRLRPEGRYALMLSRVCPEKNLHMGLDAARLAGISVILGGEVFPYAAHETYFHEKIEPRLTQVGVVHESRRCESPASHSARFVGVISRDEKPRVLSRAACLLLPSLAPETSSLVAMEALAAGVPVIAMAVGALPEIVKHETTGFLIEPSEKATEQMAEAIRRLPELSRFTCRRIAEERFPIDRMLYGYAALYLRLAVSHRRLGGHVGGMLDGSLQERCVKSSSTLLRAEQILVQEVTNTEEFWPLEAEWTALWVASPSATPFQHPAWLLPWWRQFGNDGDLYALALRLEKSRDLLSIVPLYVYRSPATSRKQLLLAGAGTTDYLDGIWAKEREEFGTLILQRISAVRERWDECSLHQLRAGSPLLCAVERAGVHFGEAEATSVIDVSKELPAKIRANVRRYSRRAERRGQIKFGVGADAQESIDLFETLVGLHSRRWEERGERGVLADERVLAHHREAIPRLMESGLLRMFHLSLSGETMGVLYGLSDPEQRLERRLYLYLIGFTDRFAELSPGTLLLHQVWLYARENGYRKVDLLRGGEIYKALWGAIREPTFAVHLGREFADAMAKETVVPAVS